MLIYIPVILLYSRAYNNKNKKPYYNTRLFFNSAGNQILL